MRRLPVLGAAALLAVLPAVAHAQSTTQDVVVKESTTVVVKEAPKPSPLTFTPYGFFVLNAFFNDSLDTRLRMPHDPLNSRNRRVSIVARQLDGPEVPAGLAKAVAEATAEDAGTAVTPAGGH